MRTKAIKSEIELPFEGALDWQFMLDFYQLRRIEQLEEVDETSYFRFFELNGAKGWFRVSLSKLPSKALPLIASSPKTLSFETLHSNALGVGSSALMLEFEIDDESQQQALVEQVRRMFDLDVNMTLIELHLESVAPGLIKRSGIRIPGVWNTWEAGVRAILGQQVSIKAAIGQLNLLVTTLHDSARQQGEHYQNARPHFPTPLDIINADLQFLRMPQSRKETLARFARLMLDQPEATFDQWLALKGIGPWTISYAALRGNSEPNRFLESDLVVKKAAQLFPSLTTKSASPWGSYATFHCWSHAG